MIDTNITWCDHTWNIARGCTKVDADCKYCYMYRDSFDGKRYNPREVKRTKTVFDFPLKLKETKSKVWQGKPLIFTSSLTDVFHPDIDSYRQEMWDIIQRCPHLIFQILTKRPERIAANLPPDWGYGYDNVWLGTIGHGDALHRLNDLLHIPATVRFVSFEPLHGYIDMNLDLGDLINIDWAIIGGESGHDTGLYRYRPCHVSWMMEIKAAIQGVGNAVFVKQMGTYLAKEMKMSDRHGGNINEFPAALQVREFPYTSN